MNSLSYLSDTFFIFGFTGVGVLIMLIVKPKLAPVSLSVRAGIFSYYFT